MFITNLIKYVDSIDPFIDYSYTIDGNFILLNIKEGNEDSLHVGSKNSGSKEFLLPNATEEHKIGLPSYYLNLIHRAYTLKVEGTGHVFPLLIANIEIECEDVQGNKFVKDIELEIANIFSHSTDFGKSGSTSYEIRMK